MTKKLSKEEISTLNFIRTFNYRIFLNLSDFLVHWFTEIWCKKLAYNCPLPRLKSNSNYGYSEVPYCDKTDYSVFSYTNNLIDEMYDADIC